MQVLVIIDAGSHYFDVIILKTLLPLCRQRKMTYNSINLPTLQLSGRPHVQQYASCGAAPLPATHHATLVDGALILNP